MKERETNAEERAGAGDEPLLAVLRERIRTQGREETAELLDVSVRTLFRTVASGRLSAPMRKALELQLLSEEGESAHRRGEDTAELAQRVGELESQVETLTQELQDTRARGHEPSGPASEDGVPAAAAPSVQGVPQPVIGRAADIRPRRSYPQLVTLEPEGGEELVYGEATPLIVEWRQARVDHLDRGKTRLVQATAWVRMRELEIALIGEHELTLPPAGYPWDRLDRDKEVWRRKESLADARAERRWALFWRWLRRVLSLGLWWH